MMRSQGFNSTGDYEEGNYHEFLETIQEHDLTPFLERHQKLVLLSHGIKDIETTVTWHPLDAPTAKEQADTNLAKAQADNALVQAGAIDAVFGRPASIRVASLLGLHNVGEGVMRAHGDVDYPGKRIFVVGDPP